MLVVEYDLDVFEVWPAGSCIGPIGSWPTGYNQPPDVVTARAVAELRALPGAMLIISGGWLPRSISRALASWTATYTGRADLRFRWNPARRSALLATFRRYVQEPEASDISSRQWIALHPAPQLRNPVDESDKQERLRQHSARKGLRIAEARRWSRRMALDPALAWLTPAEVRMLADLDPLEDVIAWARLHDVRIEGGDGIEPVLEAGRVLTIAQS
jgi:hypothetical protein